MALRGQVVDFVGLQFEQQSGQIAGVSDVPVVQREVFPLLVRECQMVKPLTDK